MVEFNPDGSIKLPDRFASKKRDQENKMLNQRCIKIRKELVSERAPKKCVLRLTLSSKLTSEFVNRIFSFFRQNSEVPMKLNQINEKEYEIEISTSFRRCSDCNSLISRFRQALEGNLIEDNGTCTFKKREFAYEDYF